MTKIVTEALHRVRRGRAKAFAAEADAPAVVEPAPVARPARIALMLALAHKIQEALDRGEVKNRAEVARGLGVTRARVSQLLGLTLLAVGVQEAILAAEGIAFGVSERALREIVGSGAWVEQAGAGRGAGCAETGPPPLALNGSCCGRGARRR